MRLSLAVSSLLATGTFGAVVPKFQLKSTLESRQSSCALPSTYQWTDAGGALAEPANGVDALKDFFTQTYNGKHLVYGSTVTGGSYGSFGELACLSLKIAHLTDHMLHSFCTCL